jgi:apolipoprotein N-acyltransferase
VLQGFVAWVGIEMIRIFICCDLDFTDTARKLARQGAQLIAVPSNDW